MSRDPVYDMPAPHSLILRMDTTNICNLDCIGCSLPESRRALAEPAASMKVEVFERIASQVFPYLSEVALSCEAEPTLHPQFVKIMNIIADATDRGRKVATRMTTNATLVTQEKMDAIFNAGLTGLAVSIDGFSPETFAKIRKNGELSKVLSALDEIVRRKKADGRGKLDSPQIQINFTLMKSNVHELIPLIEHSRRWDLENFTVVHVYSTPGRDMSNESMSRWPEESDRVLTEAWKKCQEYGISPRFPMFFKPRVTWWERLSRRFHPVAVADASPHSELACAAPWRMLKIRWDGSVHPCDLWNSFTPLGSLRTHSFDEIWRSDQYTALRKGLFEGNPTFAQCVKCDRISQDNLEGRKQKSPLAHTSTGTPASVQRQA